MYYYEVAPNQIVRAENYVFTYGSETAQSIGQVVLVEVGKKKLVGVVMREVSKPSYTTKSISAVVETTPLPGPLVDLCLWLSDYYATHLAVVLQTILPRGLTKTRRERSQNIRKQIRDRTKIVFNKDQLSALETIELMSPGSALLHGITGSGKTAVYIELVKRTLERGQSAIVLVPEISLTGQLLDEFSQHLDDILLTHSRQSEAERHQTWKQALESTTPKVVIGPRSALFMPLPNIGLIVIDEAHEPSFKQEQSPRYHALRAASVLATKHRGKLVMGSATPSVNDYYLAKESNRPIIDMPLPARDVIKPDLELIDMTKRQNFKQHRFLSDKLLKDIRETLESGNQALVFHNRRGSASTTLCENCGWQATCTRCFVPLTLHADEHTLRCHICGLVEKIPTSCPNCHHADIIHKGIGTKLVESELRKVFPDKTILRFDGDTKNSESVEQKYDELYRGDIDIIIGTQVIAKGLDLPKLRMVGVIQADAGLSLPDFSSDERTFQLLAQVVGRVGRSSHPTRIIIQSYQPTHPAVQFGLGQDYAGFFDWELEKRRHANFPPFTFLLKLTCVYKTEAAAIRNSRDLKTKLSQVAPKTIEILGPTPAFYERQHDSYRWQLILKSKQRSDLIAVLKHMPATHWQTELDGLSLL